MYVLTNGLGCYTDCTQDPGILYIFWMFFFIYILFIFVLKIAQNICIDKRNRKCVAVSGTMADC